MLNAVLARGVRGYRLVRAVRKLKRAYLRKLAIRNSPTAVKPAKLVCRKWGHAVDAVTCVLGPFLYGSTIAIDLTSSGSEHSSSEHSSPDWGGSSSEDSD